MTHPDGSSSQPEPRAWKAIFAGSSVVFGLFFALVFLFSGNARETIGALLIAFTFILPGVRYFHQIRTGLRTKWLRLNFVCLVLFVTGMYIYPPEDAATTESDEKTAFTATSVTSSNTASSSTRTSTSRSSASKSSRSSSSTATIASTEPITEVEQEYPAEPIVPAVQQPVAVLPANPAPAVEMPVAPAAPTQAPVQHNDGVHPGAFCSKNKIGWVGHTANGVPMVCAVVPDDPNARWRAQ